MGKHRGAAPPRSEGKVSRDQKTPLQSLKDAEEAGMETKMVWRDFRNGVIKDRRAEETWARYAKILPPMEDKKQGEDCQKMIIKMY